MKKIGEWYIVGTAMLLKEEVEIMNADWVNGS
jgi:hypothetical protein